MVPRDSISDYLCGVPVAESSFLLWFASQKLAPEVAARALQQLTRKDWRARLAKQVKEASDLRFSTRQLKRWLSRKDVWNQLVDPSTDDLEKLLTSLTQEMSKRRLFSRRWTSANAAEDAERLLDVVLGEFLASLDASYATAVAHARQMSALHGIRSMLEAHLSFDERILSLPPVVAEFLRAARKADSASAERLATLLTDPSVTPLVAARQLVQAPPASLAHGPLQLWIALAELLVAGKFAAEGADCFQHAADEGLPDRVAWYVRAGFAALEAEQRDRASVLVEQAAAIDESHPYVSVARAAVSGELSRVCQLVDLSNTDPFLVGLAAQAEAFQGNVDAAISRCLALLDIDEHRSGGGFCWRSCIFSEPSLGREITAVRTSARRFAKR